MRELGVRDDHSLDFVDGFTGVSCFRSIYTPSLIVKKPLEPKEGGGQFYVLMTDGSER